MQSFGNKVGFFLLQRDSLNNFQAKKIFECGGGMVGKKKRQSKKIFF